jgi:hypothetical protein
MFFYAFHLKLDISVSGDSVRLLIKIKRELSKAIPAIGRGGP